MVRLENSSFFLELDAETTDRKAVALGVTTLRAEVAEVEAEVVRVHGTIPYSRPKAAIRAPIAQRAVSPAVVAGAIEV